MSQDLDTALRFISILDPMAGPHDWNYRGIHPTTGEVHKVDSLQALLALNIRGFGAYVVVNAGGHKASEITRVRALFVDFDQVDDHLDRLSRFPLEPSIIVETSPGKHHAYWCVEGMPLDEFSKAQKRLIALLGSDPAVHDLPRVMRLPGYIHNKGEAFQSNIAHEGGAGYAWPVIKAELDKLPEQAERDRSKPDWDFGGDTNLHDTILKMTGRMAQQGLNRDQMVAVMAQFVEYIRHRDPLRCANIGDEIIRAIDGALDKFAPEEPLEKKPDGTVLDGFDLADAAKAPVYLIDGIIQEGAHGVIGGESGTYKSFVCFGMAHSVITGKDFLGHKVYRTGPVLYVAGEGAGGLGRRWRGTMKKLGSVGKGKFFIYKDGVNLNCNKSMGKLMEVILKIKPAMIILDTFASQSGGIDENSAGDVGKALRVVRLVADAAGATSAIVHHYGKNKLNGLRGASNFRADVDFVIECDRDEDTKQVWLRSVKEKDDQPFKDMPIDVEVVDLGLFGQDGKEATTLVVVLGAVIKFANDAKAGPIAKAEGQMLAQIMSHAAKHVALTKTALKSLCSAKQGPIFINEKEGMKMLERLIREDKVLVRENRLFIFKGKDL